MTKLEQLICCIQKDHVYVQTHNYPDQDALASAMGLQFLLQTKGIHSKIVYHGLIDKDNTLKMIELLHIKLYPVESLHFHPSDEIIIVDGQKGNINMSATTGSEIACIDHHGHQATRSYRFYDIRSEVGACSSIIAEYFFENRIKMTKEIATALSYGIKMDTMQLSRRVNDLDINMFSNLYRLADHKKLYDFDMNRMSLTDLTSYQQAISNLKVSHNIAIANIGDNCSEGIIGSVNDFLLTISEIEFTLIYSFRAGGIKFSVRSSNSKIDASEVIRRALCGLGDGGGHNDMAAGFIPNIINKTKARELESLVEERVISLVQNMRLS